MAKKSEKQTATIILGITVELTNITCYSSSESMDNLICMYLTCSNDRMVNAKAVLFRKCYTHYGLSYTKMYFQRKAERSLNNETFEQR